jgi:precorrin-2 C20-methyltransferase
VATLYAVGVGPGDPELLTRRAERLLRSADVVMAPFSRKGEDSVALEIVREFLEPERQEIVSQHFPMTSDPELLLTAWQEAASRLAGLVAAGKNVAFITIGDPMLYSTFIYLLHIIRQSFPLVPLEIVPGISSINTASAVAGIPLAEADQRISIIPATAGITKIIEALTHHETVVLLKVKPLYAPILELLRQLKRTEDAVFVERVGSNQQKVITDFESMTHHQPDYLSLMIIRSK